MHQRSLLRVVVRRLSDDWKLLLSVFIGIALATTLAAGTPIYLDSLGELSFRVSLNRLPEGVVGITVTAPDIPLTEQSIQAADDSLNDAIESHLSPIYLGRQLYLRGGVSIVGLPDVPLPEGGGTGVIVSRGYFQNLSNLEEHVRFVDGRMASSETFVSDDATAVEAVISVQTSDHFEVGVGDDVFLSPRLGPASVVAVRIIGVVEPAEASRELWAEAGDILDPAPLTDPPPLFVQADPDERPLALFVTEEVIFEVGGDFERVGAFGQDAYIKSGSFLVGHPARPLPQSGESGLLLPLGFLQHLSDLEQHASFIDGRMAGDGVQPGPNGPELEAVISSQTARGVRIGVGDVVVVSPTLGAKPVLSVRIAGVFEPADPSVPYWTNAVAFLDPGPLSLNPPVLVQAASEADPVALFVTRKAIVEAVVQTYPGSPVTPLWSVLVDREGLKGWHVEEARGRLKGFEDDLAVAMPGTSAGTGLVRGLTDAGERRGLFSKVPLLIILSVMVATVLVLLSMMVSYLAQSRENDAALLRTRGAGTLHLLRLYAIEGLAMTAAAVVLAPLLAMAVVALAGLVPPFRDLTEGSLMPVKWGLMPFLVAIGAGLLCLVVFVTPTVVGARGVLLQRLQQSRPPTLPFIHRYHVDIGLLVVGALAYWELQQRGSLVSGGLFKDVEVNETLLLAPVLFMIVVALAFVRFFPLAMRFISGESPAIVHLLAAVAVLALAGGVAFRGVRDDGGIDWAGPAALALAAGGVYWATVRARHPGLPLLGLLLQAGLIAGFVSLRPLGPDQLLFAPTLGLIGLVPAQVVFLLVRRFAKVSPAWLLMGLLRMSRNPLQYTWLVLLLVLVTGTGVFATTVGATLERSHQERILYEVPVDFRVSFTTTLTRRLVGATATLTSAFREIPGVTLVTKALRTSSIVSNSTVDLLAVEASEFAKVSWYREDFSSRSLGDVTGELRPAAEGERIAVPVESTSIGIWAGPVDLASLLPVFIQIEDGGRMLHTVFVGSIGPPEWTLLRGEVPPDLVGPLSLVSVLIFQSGGLESPGTVLVDDIHVVLGPGGQEQVLEDFGGESGWLPVYTSSLSSDEFSIVAGLARRGARSGKFSFGSSSVNGLQGFYHSVTKGPLPVVVSSSLVAATGHGLNAQFLAKIDERWIPVVVKAVVDYFPTLNPEGAGFMIADFASLLAHTNVLLEFYMARPNELFIAHTPEAYGAVRETMMDLTQQGEGEVHDGTDLLEELRTDPYVTAGWRPIVLLSTGVGVLIALVGYVTYLLLFARRLGNETGSLQSMGLSRAQLKGLLGFEHLAIAAIGLGLGTWAGFQMSRLMVSPLSVTETGDTLVPPFLLTTNWGLLVPTILAIVALFVASLLVLSRDVGRRELHTLTRTPEA